MDTTHTNDGAEMMTETERFHLAAFAVAVHDRGLGRSASLHARTLTRTKFDIPADADWNDITGPWSGGGPDYSFLNRADTIAASGYDAADFDG